jgi:acetyl esterase
MTAARDPMLDPDAAALLREFRGAGGASFQDLGVAAARAAYRLACARHALDAPALVTRDHRLGAVQLRAYLPEAPAAGPALVYCHGGGWVVGDLDTHDAICRRLAAQACMMVFAVDYRLAPEHRFPAALDDIRAVWRGLAGAAPGWGYAPSAFGLAGDSAGASLAAAAALGDGPRAFCQLLFYPAVDLTGAGESYTAFADGLPLTAPTMRWFIDQYLAPGHSRADPGCSPLFADLHGAPPSFIATAGADPLRSEGVAFARALSTAGVRVAQLHLPGQLHGFLTAGGALDLSPWALDAAAAFARIAFRHWRPVA